MMRDGFQAEEEERLAGKDTTEAARKFTEAFGDSYRKVMENAAEAQQRNVRLAQGWAESITGVLESQAETNQALTRAMESYTKVVEEALESQERTNRALAESLQSYREVVERATAVQEKNADLARGFFESVTSELERGAKDSQAASQELLQASQRQMEAFQSTFQSALDSYAELMNAPFAFYQKNLEAFGKKSE